MIAFYYLGISNEKAVYYFDVHSYKELTLAIDWIPNSFHLILLWWNECQYNDATLAP